jgi:hypothetical protein
VKITPAQARRGYLYEDIGFTDFRNRNIEYFDARFPFRFYYCFHLHDHATARSGWCQYEEAALR